MNPALNFFRQSLAPALYLVGVPIGAARDITLRALDVLASADRLVAEDTRSLRKLMDLHGVPLDGRRIVALHDHSPPHKVTSVVDDVALGHSVAYASEAGMPLIADPGFSLVQQAHEKGLTVTAVPGPTALTTALALSGLGTDAFYFAGFLPASAGARRAKLSKLADIEATLVFYEAPHRLEALLQDAVASLGAHRGAAICRELTKKFEEIRRGTLSELLEGARTEPARGEIVVLIGRDTQEKVIDFDTELGAALQEMSLKDAVAHVVATTGVKKRSVYQRALELAKSRGS